MSSRLLHKGVRAVMYVSVRIIDINNGDDKECQHGKNGSVHQIK